LASREIAVSLSRGSRPRCRGQGPVSTPCPWFASHALVRQESLAKEESRKQKPSGQFRSHSKPGRTKKGEETRREKSRPLVDASFAWCDEQAALVDCPPVAPRPGRDASRRAGGPLRPSWRPAGATAINVSSDHETSPLAPAEGRGEGARCFCSTISSVA
jgi:hypothetical protein